MKIFRAGVALFLVALLLSVLSSISQTSFATEKNPYSIDPTSPREYALKYCINANDLDCLESLTVIYENGKKITPKLIEAPTGTSLNGLNLVREYPQYIFTYPKNSSNGDVTLFTVNMRVQTPAYQEDYLPMKSPRFLFEFGNVENLGVNDKFQVVFRASWLKPLDVAMYGKNATFKEEAITGGHRYTMGVKKSEFAFFTTQEKNSMVDSPEFDLLRAEAIEERMYFGINHANSVPGQSVFDTACSDYGYTVESSNATIAGQPFMDSPESLNFAISSPHLKPDGSLNQGYFTAQIHKTWIDCKWPGNTLTQNTGFSIQVVYPDGVRQVATTSASLKDGIFYLQAAGFHYSSPRIVLTGSKVATPKPSASPIPASASAKKKTITCVKGKVTKKVTEIKPKCPTGFKKK